MSETILFPHETDAFGCDGSGRVNEFEFISEQTAVECKTVIIVFTHTGKFRVENVSLERHVVYEYGTYLVCVADGLVHPEERYYSVSQRFAMLRTISFIFQCLIFLDHLTPCRCIDTGAQGLLISPYGKRTVCLWMVLNGISEH